VLKANPDDYLAFSCWGSALLDLWHLTKDPVLLDQAAGKLEQHDKLNPKNPYNSACLAAIHEDEERCRKLLLVCKEHGTLPNAKHLLADRDLETMRDKPWFQALVAA
jgi:hypothetical protein